MTRSIQALAIVSLIMATGAFAQPEFTQRLKPSEPQRTTLWFDKGRVDQGPLTLHIRGGVATSLVFDKVEVDSTAFAGDAGNRFRTLEVGKQVVTFIPKQDLADGEHLSLMVKLKDATEIPFDLVSPALYRRPDGQVDVSLHEEDVESLRRALENTRSELEALEAENLQYRRESDSPEYALATLLAQGLTDQTPFIEDSHTAMNEAGVNLAVITFRRERATTDIGKTAVVFEVTNKNPKEFWALDEVRLSSASTGEIKTVAVRASASVLGAGQRGRVAVVFDSDQFGTGSNTEHLVLELWRAGGIRQAYVELAKLDEDARPVPVKAGRSHDK